MGALRQIVLGLAFVPLVTTLALSGELLDRVLVQVNSLVILQSDLDTEVRLQKLMSGTPNAAATQADREAALDRLIDRVLLKEEMRGIDLLPSSDPQITAQIAEVRKQLKGAESDEGWRKLLARAGLAEDDVRDRIAEQVNTNLFLEAKFRPTLSVNNVRIQSYYKEVLVPELKKKGAEVPPLQQVSAQIEQILTEQTLNDLFGEWMKGMRNQARIRVIDTALKPRGLETPSSLAGMNFLPLRISDEQAAQSAPAPTTPTSPATPQQR